ncbi:hypothetical protein niasHT_038366 [Heterodera trifolii]|uniref:Uncharacterized protein n=1 Tax=Heterodera trifolii TaxID=157864 RepID=A0ABD2IS29_9BILA
MQRLLQANVLKRTRPKSKVYSIRWGWNVALVPFNEWDDFLTQPPLGRNHLLKIVLSSSKFQRIALGKWKEKRNQIRTARLLIRPNLTKEQLDAERQQRMANRRPFPSK